jgi:uncharacterized membrane protein
MTQIKVFFSVFVAGILIDFLWIGVLAKNFYQEQLAELMRVQDGKMDMILWPAGVVYVLMTLGIVFYVLPKFTSKTSWFETFLWGGLFGIIVYGTYDFTNYATLAKWPVAFSMVDVSWGGVLCGLLAMIGLWSQRKIA